MWVKHFTGEPKDRQRHAAEQWLEICCAVIDLPNKGLRDKIVLVILDALLAGSESEFEPPQTFVGKGCPAQMQGVKSVVYTSLDSLPQEIVVGSQPLKRIVRGTELVEGLSAMVKKDSRGHRFALAAYGCDKSVALRQHVPGDVLKKQERLRR